MRDAKLGFFKLQTTFLSQIHCWSCYKQAPLIGSSVSQMWNFECGDHIIIPTMLSTFTQIKYKKGNGFPLSYVFFLYDTIETTDFYFIVTPMLCSNK